MARPNPLNDPDFAQAVAEAFAAGVQARQMCEMFGVRDKGTISRWRRHPAVKARALKIIEDRVLQVTRKVDAEISDRLQEPEKLTTKELIEIRKEFLGGALRASTEKADDETINDAVTFLEKNPEAAEALDLLLSGKTPIPGGVDAA